MVVHSSPWRMNEKNNRWSDKWPRIVHVKSSLVREKKGGGGGARAEPMTLPFSVTAMVKPVRMQVISANIKKYFTSIRGHGEYWFPLFEWKPLPVCRDQYAFKPKFHAPRSFRIALVSTPWDGLINQTPRVFEKLSDTHPWSTLMNDRESVKIIRFPLFESSVRLTRKKKRKKEQ